MKNELRQRVVEEARSWIGTPYHHCADVKGVGADCAMLLVRIYCDLGVAPLFDPRPYAPQWFLHREQEIYLNWLSKYADQITEDEADSGDIIMYKFGRCVAHGAIIVDSQSMIHAYLPAGNVEMIERRAPLVHGKIHSYWSPF
jgi:NlpC/P60 family putative phage cell wall peptidase